MDVGECMGSATAANAVIATTDVRQCVGLAIAASAVIVTTITICMWTDCGATCRVWFDAVTAATSAGITITRILF